MSPRKLFVQEMEDLRQDVLQMGEWVIDGYTCLFETLEKKDGETMSRFVRHDRVIGDMQRNIEARCLNLLTRQTPVAGDLRTVSASLKIASDLERIGNHLSDMAELFTRMGYVDLNTISAHFGPMIAETKVSAEKSVKACVERNMDLAREVIKLDDTIDDYFNKVKDDLVVALGGKVDSIDNYVDALMVAKYLEKIADHGVNIANWEIFQETGDMEDERLL